MKKLITICLLLSTFFAYSQKEFDWEHPVGGVAVSEMFFWTAYSASKDEDFSFRLTCIITPLIAVGKESFDVIAVPNGEFSCIDAGKSIITSIGTAYLNRQICKWVKKRRKRKWDKKMNIEF